jgi:hypothetical protein
MGGFSDGGWGLGAATVEIVLETFETYHHNRYVVHSFLFSCESKDLVCAFAAYLVH